MNLEMEIDSSANLSSVSCFIVCRKARVRILSFGF